MESVGQTCTHSSQTMQAEVSMVKSLCQPRFLPVFGETAFGPGTTVMMPDGQMFSHILQPMQASSPCSSWTRAKLVR